MRITPRHSWDLSPAEARELQRSLAKEVDVSSPVREWSIVAGADISYSKHSPVLHAAVVVLRADTWEVIERQGVTGEARFPYVPGLLSFREIPAVLEAFARLQTVPHVVLCDGQGFAHPRRIGLASHLGLWLGLPTVGCAKSRLCGTFDEPGPERGARSSLVDQGEVVGAVLRTRANVRPLFVSPGHLCDIDSAVAVTLAATPKYRVPIPTREAHVYVNELRRASGVGVSGGEPDV